jgi:hypothetical protein
MKRIILSILPIVLIAVVAAYAVENTTWGKIKTETPPDHAGKLVVSGTTAGGPVDYLIKGWGQSDAKDLFHILFDGAPGYTGQYEGATWVFTQPFTAMGGNCTTQSFIPEGSSDPVDMVVCSKEQGAYVNGTLHIDRRLVTLTPIGFTPADPFSFAFTVPGPPYISWPGTYSAQIVEFAVKGNMAAIRATVTRSDPPDPTSPDFLWLVEDRGSIPDQPIMGSLETMLNWTGDRRTYVAPVDAWANDANISTCVELLQAGINGELEDYPADNKDLKAWPIGGVIIKKLR